MHGGYMFAAMLHGPAIHIQVQGLAGRDGAKQAPRS